MSTVQLVLDELVDGQNQAEILVNEAFEGLDAIIQLSVKDRDLSAPPGSPAEGDRYIVKATGTGAWAGHDGDLAVWLNGAWRFWDLKEGWLTWVDDENKLFLWDGAAFIEIAQTGGTSAPVGASYVVISSDGTLTAERVITAGTAITLTDGGANSTITIAHAQVSTGDLHQDYILATASRIFSGAPNVTKAAGDMYTAKVTADANNRVVIQHDRISFGGGPQPIDTVLRRSAADQWTFDDEVRMGADLRLNGGFKLVIRDSDDSHQTTLITGNQTGNLDYTLPTAAPATNGYVLTATTAGVMSWSGTSPDSGATQHRVLVPRCPHLTSASLLLTSGDAYFCYVGLVPTGVVVKYVELFLQAAGSGAQTAEVGIFSTPSAPNKAGQTLTKIEATGTVDSLTTGNGTMKRNTSAFTTATTAPTHLWLGIRTAMATNQPNLPALCQDWSEGMVLTTVASGALTGASTFSGTIVSLGTGLAPAVCPHLRGTLD